MTERLLQNIRRCYNIYCSTSTGHELIYVIFIIWRSLFSLLRKGQMFFKYNLFVVKRPLEGLRPLDLTCCLTADPPPSEHQELPWREHMTKSLLRIQNRQHPILGILPITQDSIFGGICLWGPYLYKLLKRSTLHLDLNPVKSK